METAPQHTVSGSPNSSEEIESHHGTPATKLSAFSPEDFRTQPKGVAFGTLRSNLPPAFTLGHTQGNGPKVYTVLGSQDPFVTTPGCTSNGQGPNGPPKLSPVASSFTPFKLQTHASVNSTLQSLNISPPKPHGQAAVLDLGYGATSPVPITVSANMVPGGHPLPLCSEVLMSSINQQISSVSSNSHPSHEPESTKIGQFSSDSETSRSLVISQIPKATSKEDVDGFFSVCTPGSHSYSIAKNV